MKQFFKWLFRAFVFMAAVVVVLFALDYVLPPGWELGALFILSIASAALSLMFSYFKGWRVEFASLLDKYKSWVNILAVIIVAGVVYGLGCSGLLTIVGLVCTVAGLKTFLTYIAVSLVINQTFDYLSVDSPDVKALKAGKIVKRNTIQG
jgi:hypothetical protein